jgi:hypothetical protein
MDPPHCVCVDVHSEYSGKKEMRKNRININRKNNEVERKV